MKLSPKLLFLSVLSLVALVFILRDALADGVVTVTGGSTAIGTVGSAQLDTLANCFAASGTNGDTRNWQFVNGVQIGGTAAPTSGLNVSNTTAAAGSQVLTNGNANIGGILSAGSQIRAGDGTASLPGIAFTSETGTGFYRSSGGIMNYTSQGTREIVMTASLCGAKNDFLYGWYSPAFAGFDTAIGRNAAAVMEINAGTLGNLTATLKTGSGIFTNTVTATNSIATYKNNGLAPTSITVGASEFLYTNTQTVNIQVFIDANGATTSLKMNGTAIFSTLVGGDHTIILQPQDYIGVTYSVATPLMRYREF